MTRNRTKIWDLNYVTVIMSATTKRLTPGLDLRRGTAEHLPIETDEIDCVTCQFALMYFHDRARAISEIARVSRTGGRVTVATWAAVEESPGYAAMVEPLGDEIGDWAAEATRAPFCIGTPDHLGDPAADVIPRCRRRTPRPAGMLQA
jgi:SAM-dependent methyltransferase